MVSDTPNKQKEAAAVAGMIDGSKIQLQRMVKYADGRHKGSDLDPRSHIIS